MTAPLRTRQAATAVAPMSSSRTETQRRPSAPPRARPDLRLVDHAVERERRLRRVLTGGLLVTICAGLFAIVALRVVMAQGQVEVDRLEMTVDTQLATQQRLRLTVAELEAPTRIVSAARSRLGMVNPGAVISLTPPPAPAR